MSVFFEKLDLNNTNNINVDSEFYEKNIVNPENYFDFLLEKDENFLIAKDEVKCFVNFLLS